MRPLRLTLAVVVVAALAGAGAQVVRSAVAGDAGADQSARPLTATVERRTLRDVLVLRGIAAYAPRATLRLERDGRVTALHVAGGDVVVDQQPVVDIDGRAVVAVHGDVPFWRDLGRDTRGADVLQLQRMLERAGHEPGPLDGRYGAATAAAVRRWQEAHGLPVDGRFRSADVVVALLPARVGEVRIEVGEFVARGAEALLLTADRAEARVELTASARLQVEVGDDAEVEVVATGASTEARVSGLSDAPEPGDPASDGEGASRPAGDTYVGYVRPTGELAAVEGADVRVTIVLAEAPDRLAVPLAAVVLDGQGRTGVRVLRGEGRITFTPVATGLSEGAYVAVSGDLDDGDEVVLGTAGDGQAQDR